MHMGKQNVQKNTLAPHFFFTKILREDAHWMRQVTEQSRDVCETCRKERNPM